MAINGPSLIWVIGLRFSSFFNLQKHLPRRTTGIVKRWRAISSADFMKNQGGYAGVEMEDVARYLLSQDRVDGVLITLDTVSRKIAALKAMTEVEFSQLKKVKDIDEILPRLVVLEQTLTRFGYREIQVFERELGVGLIVERGANQMRVARNLSGHPSRETHRPVILLLSRRMLGRRLLSPPADALSPSAKG